MLTRMSRALSHVGRQTTSYIREEAWFLQNALVDYASLPIETYYNEINDFLKSAPLLQLPEPQYTTADLLGKDTAVMGSQLATKCGNQKQIQQGKRSQQSSHVDHCIVPSANTSSLFQAIVTNGNPDVFQGIIPRSILQYKWQAFGLRKHTLHLINYLMGLLSLSALSLNTSGNTDISTFGIIMCVMTALPVLYGLRREIFQLYMAGLLSYFSTVLNWFDLTHLMLTTACIVLFIAQSPALQVVIAVALFVRWFGILYYLQPFDSTGALVRMILQIIIDIRWFLMILCIAILAGANAFFLLVRTDDSCAALDDVACVSPYMRAQDSVFAMFDMLIMGTFSSSDFDFGPYTALLKVMYALARVLVSVVLLNLLIALMNNSFSAISERSDLEICMLRANMIMEQEQLMSAKEKRDPRLFPRYIHVLVKHGENVAVKAKTNDDAVMAKIHELSNRFLQLELQIKADMRVVMDRQQAEINEKVVKRLQHIEQLLTNTMANTTAGLIETDADSY
jgi:hypothetical protein